MARLEVHENPFARIEIDREARMVKLVRTANQLHAELLERIVEDFQLVVPLRERPQLVLLQDMRLAPLIRNDELDRALLAVVPRLVSKFAARAVLLASAIGALQASRFVREAGGTARTFTEEAEAIHYLQTEANKLRAAP